MISIIQVVRELGYKPNKYLNWQLGPAVREKFRQMNGGRYPVKRLREKTDGHGSHCFALYPEEFRDEIERFVEFFYGRSTCQEDLFR